MVSHPPRLANFGYVGKHYYFVTFTTYLRRRVFLVDERVDPVRTQLLRSSQKYDMAIHAYCLMPDHGHLLAQGRTSDSDLHSFMCHFKQQTGWNFRQRAGRRLWQTSYFDHVLRPEEGIDRVIAYIINNPVRAGLVDRPEEYPYWDSFTQTREGLLEFVRGAGDWKPTAGGQPIKG